MRDPNPFHCDQCGRKKGEANHWWMAVILWPESRTHGLKVFVWQASEEQFSGVKHLCSQECVLKEVAAFMNQPVRKPIDGILNCENCGAQVCVEGPHACSFCPRCKASMPQSANAVEAQPANEPAEERQNKNERLFPNVTTMTN